MCDLYLPRLGTARGTKWNCQRFGLSVRDDISMLGESDKRIKNYFISFIM